MDVQEIKKRVWDTFPGMVNGLTDILSISPMYNARLTQTVGIRPYPRNRGCGNFVTWTLLRDERTAPVDTLATGAIENITDPLRSKKNIVVSEDKKNDSADNYKEEILKNSWKIIQTGIRTLCEMLKNYIKKYPGKAYGGAFLQDMDINFCKESASGEFVDYIVKALLYQGVLDYTGEKGPRGAHMLKVVRDVPYEIQPQIDFSKFRKGVSKGEALASLTFTDLLSDLRVVHQKKWKACRDKRELPFDFYDSTNGIAIEVDGLQHFKPIEYFGGEKSFKNTVSHDTIKNRFISDEEIKLIRIDSTCRDVRECIVKAYEDPDKLSSITLYGDNYDRRYCESRIPDGIVVDFDHMNIW